MKTTICTLLAFVVINASANNGKYLEAMQNNIGKVYRAETKEELQQAVNAFHRIAETEKTKWEPYYYAGFGLIMMATREDDGSQKDRYLDEAMKVIERAEALAPDESEVIALEGFAYMIRLTVDPASRGQEFSSLGMRAFGKALKLNPENPRALALMAQMQFGTAQFFGSSTAEACQTLRKSLEKFESYQNENVLAPAWGKAMAQGLASKCE